MANVLVTATRGALPAYLATAPWPEVVVIHDVAGVRENLRGRPTGASPSPTRSAASAAATGTSAPAQNARGGLL